jgi:GAF domain-containing protein
LEIGQVGIVGHVANTGAPRIALDIETDAVFFENPDLPETRSEMALALKVGSRIMGVLDVQSIDANAFHQEDIETLSVLADQLSIAIENARLFEETRRALATAQETYQRYFGQSWNQFIRRKEHNGYIYDDGKVTPLAKAKKKTRFTGKNSLSTSLLLRGQVIGVLEIQPKENNRTWSDNEIALVNAAAERAALALENARLLHDAQRRAAREQTIGIIATAISASSDVDSILRTTVQEVGNQIGNTDVIFELDIESNGK